MCRLCVILVAGAVALGGASMARAKTFTPPEGCTLYATVQQQGCVVSNHYRCDQDKPGDQWRADFGANGAFFVSKIDAETEWLQSYDLSTGAHETLVKGAKDPASFTKLLATGRDDFDFSTVTDTGRMRHFTGHDALTGKTVTVSGVTLKQTEFQITATDDEGKVLWQSSGHEYIEPDWRIFLSGAGIWQDDKGKIPFDNTPMMISQKGQPGFGATVPDYGCNDTMSSLMPRIRPASLTIRRAVE